MADERKRPKPKDRWVPEDKAVEWLLSQIVGTKQAKAELRAEKAKVKRGR